jgi:hypothetical protein
MIQHFIIVLLLCYAFRFSLRIIAQEGSWKDIGMSITHFVLGNLLALLTTGTAPPHPRGKSSTLIDLTLIRSGVDRELLLRVFNFQHQ